MVHLIINADDFGLSKGVCRGIVQGAEEGVVTAATAMVCTPLAEELITDYSAPLKGRLGLHLQLTKGRPCLPASAVPSLVNEHGEFPDSVQDLAPLRNEEVLAEFRAQVARMRSLGLEPSHIDAHHHIHRLPVVFPAYCRLALELGVPARGLGAAHSMALRQQGVPTADLFIGEWFKNDLTPDHLLAILESYLTALPRGGVAELMTHPGYEDAALTACSSYTADRETELQCLCSAELRQGLAALDITLAGPEILLQRQGGAA